MKQAVYCAQSNQVVALQLFYDAAFLIDILQIFAISNLDALRMFNFVCAKQHVQRPFSNHFFRKFPKTLKDYRGSAVPGSISHRQMSRVLPISA